MARRRSPRERSGGLDALKLGDSPFVRDIAGVQRRFWFDQDNVDLFIRNGTVLDAVRIQNEFAFVHHTLTIAEFHAERAFHDEKKVVFVIVMMPQKFSFALHALDQALTPFTDAAGLAVLANHAQPFLHAYPVL